MSCALGTFPQWFTPSFHGAAGVGSQWDFSGSTLVTGSYIRLTPDERSKQGSVWNTVVRTGWPDLETHTHAHTRSHTRKVDFKLDKKSLKGKNVLHFQNKIRKMWSYLFAISFQFNHWFWMSTFSIVSIRVSHKIKYQNAYIHTCISINVNIHNNMYLHNIPTFYYCLLMYTVFFGRDVDRQNTWRLHEFLAIMIVLTHEVLTPTVLIIVCVADLQPCHLKDWELHVQFKVHGSGKKNLHGDGIAVWYTRDRLHTGNAHLTLSPADMSRPFC